jgi:hypothetical protein
LAQVRDGVRPAIAVDDTSIERWDGEEFIYLEAHVTGEPTPDIDIDICFQGHRVFIKMARLPPGPMSPT